MNPDYNTEQDTNKLCTDTGNKEYWKCIGDKKWAVSLSQLYIKYATVILSQYRPSLRKGHLSNIQYIYGYLNNSTSTSIKFNRETPEYNNFNTI